MFAKIENGFVTQYPYTLEQLRQDNPNTSFTKNPTAETLASFGMVGVGYQAAPEYNPVTQRLEHSALPVLVDGAWVLTKTVVDKTPEQLQIDTANKAAQVRSDRNKKLTSTDWTQVADAPVDKAAWAAYRQALRDISGQAGFPWTITWPTQPE